MILVDTTPLVALCDPRDSLNKTALKDLKRLRDSQLAVCEPVLTEACFHLSAPSQRMRLHRMLQQLGILRAPVHEHEPMWAEIFDWLAKYSDHEPDWADAYLAVLCGRDRNHKVWTYDVEFKTIWRRPDGTRIPTAVKL